MSPENKCTPLMVHVNFKKSSLIYIFFFCHRFQFKTSMTILQELIEQISMLIQKYSRAGVLLTQSYTTPKCSPSRAALMTGRYPWKIGMQRGAIERFQPDGLNISIKILPQYLKQAGYNTHAVISSLSFSVAFSLKN